MLLDATLKPDNLVLPSETVDEAVRRYLLRALSESLRKTMEHREWLLEATKRWEGMRSTRSLDSDDPGTPWAWASNVGIPLEAMSGESLIPRFNASTVDADPIFRVTLPQEAKDLAQFEQPLTHWYQDFYRRTLRIRRVRKETYLNMCMDGDAIEGVEWETLWRQRANTVALYQDANGGVLVDEQGKPRVFGLNLQPEEIPQDPLTGKPMKRLLVEQKGQQKTYTGPRIRAWRINEVIWPWYGATPDLQELDFLAFQMWKATSWFKTREGDPIQGQLKNVTELLDRVKAGVPASFDTPEERSLTEGVKFPTVPGKVLVWLAYFRFDVDSDGVEEECVAWIAPVQRLLLGWRLLPFSKRPAFHYQLFSMPGRVTGRGLPHVLKGMRDMVDFYANSSNNRTNLFLDPPLLYEIDSGFDPDTMQFGTGAQWGPLAPGAIAGRKVSALELPESQEALADKFLNFYMAIGQRLTSITDFNLGGPSKSAVSNIKTARGTIAVLGESSTKFADWIQQFQEVAEEEAEFIDELIQTLGTQEDLAFMSIVPMLIQVFKLPKLFKATGNSQNMNKQGMQQVLLTLFDLLSKDPIFALKPETQLELRKRLIDQFDLDLPMPEANEVQDLQAQQLAQALAKLPPEALLAAAAQVKAKQGMTPGNGAPAQPGQSPMAPGQPAQPGMAGNGNGLPPLGAPNGSRLTP